MENMINERRVIIVQKIYENVQILVEMERNRHEKNVIIEKIMEKMGNVQKIVNC